LGGSAKEDKETYLRNTFNLLEESGIFLITSCNWTKDELIKQFEEYFHPHHVIPTPVFSFGGKTGNMVSSVVFKKRKS